MLESPHSFFSKHDTYHTTKSGRKIKVVEMEITWGGIFQIAFLNSIFINLLAQVWLNTFGTPDLVSVQPQFVTELQGEQDKFDMDTRRLRYKYQVEDKKLGNRYR